MEQLLVMYVYVVSCKLRKSLMPLKKIVTCTSHLHAIIFFHSRLGLRVLRLHFHSVPLKRASMHPDKPNKLLWKPSSTNRPNAMQFGDTIGARHLPSETLAFVLTISDLLQSP